MGFTDLLGFSSISDNGNYTSILLTLLVSSVAACIAVRLPSIKDATRPTFRGLLTISSNIALLLSISHILSFYLHSAPATTELKSFQISPIPISNVLKQNLALAKHSWEHGVLTHALFELQNPELTVFAGPGYGVDLRQPYKDRDGQPVALEAFPDGMLPRCGGGENSGGAWGRYDEWARVKGLREAARKISTVLPSGRRAGGQVEGVERPWLFRSNESGAADSASLGWAALLLERAGVADLMNPMAPGSGRNAYGEAVDEFVSWLFEENPRVVLDGGVIDGNCKRFRMRSIGESEGRRWALSHRVDAEQLWADFAFMVPPFLAVYAVARQDEKWLWEAVEQLFAYRDVLVERCDGCTLWRHIASQPETVLEGACCTDEGLWLTGNAWALAGITRVLAVLERWNGVKTLDTYRTVIARTNGGRQRAAVDALKAMANDMLQSLSSETPRDVESRLLRNYLHQPSVNEHDAWAFGDAAGTALVASSVYRLAHLGHLGDAELVGWADSLYNAVTSHIGTDGLLGHVTTVSEVPATHGVNGTSEGQSFVVMMYAARRDCVKLGICQETMALGWFRGITSSSTSVLLGGIGLLISYYGPLSY